MSTSWKVFFSWLDVVKGFFLTMERLLRSSTTVFLRGRPGLFMSHTSAFFFSQNVPNCWFGHSGCSCYLFDGLVLFLNPNNCLFCLYGELPWLQDMGSEQQLPNANGTLRISSRPFTCLIDVEIMKEKPTPVHEIACETIYQLLLVPWKRGEVQVKGL